MRADWKFLKAVGKINRRLMLDAREAPLFEAEVWDSELALETVYDLRLPFPDIAVQLTMPATPMAMSHSTGRTARSTPSR